MTRLNDLFDMELFQEMLEAGFIKSQRHPEFPDLLAIVNYTKRAQVNYHWNEVTEQCRGLIYNPVTFEVKARPFRKFYNYDESQAAKIQGDEFIAAYDKVDGSLGVLYMRPDGEVAVATRGSFTSEQAKWATNWVHSDGWRACKFRELIWPERTTDLFEIVYPENRIVVSYDRAGLVYLGSVDIASGQHAYDDVWSGVVDTSEVLYVGEFAELFNEPERKNAEGFVVVARDGKRMVKVKYEEYVRLHRIVTNLSKRTVWEMMQGPWPDKVEEIATQVDEEHAKWVRDVAQDLVKQYVSCATYLSEVAHRTDKISTRKEKALAVKGEDAWVKACYFAALDGKSYTETLWKFLRPEGEQKGEVVDD